MQNNNQSISPEIGLNDNFSANNENISANTLPEMLAEDEEVEDDDDLSSESSYTSDEDDDERKQLLMTDFQSFSP